MFSSSKICMLSKSFFKNKLYQYHISQCAYRKIAPSPHPCLKTFQPADYVVIAFDASILWTTRHLLLFFLVLFYCVVLFCCCLASWSKKKKKICSSLQVFCPVGKYLWDKQRTFSSLNRTFSEERESGNLGDKRATLLVFFLYQFSASANRV